jgi:hypothetical protein
MRLGGYSVLQRLRRRVPESAVIKECINETSALAPYPVDVKGSILLLAEVHLTTIGLVGESATSDFPPASLDRKGSLVTTSWGNPSAMELTSFNRLI